MKRRVTKTVACLVIALAGFVATTNGQTSDYILNGTNSWILHTPDDGRATMYFAPGTNGGNWNWQKNTQFRNDGSVHFTGDPVMGGQNSWTLHTPDDGRTTLWLAPGSYNDNWNWANATRFNNDGSVVIGNITNPAGYKLCVQQGILTERIKVSVYGSAQWADYVFAKDYKLMPLAKVEQYIKANQHLPNVPSAAEMVKEGNDLGKTTAKLLEKIEELTLYMIEMEKKQAETNKQNEWQQKEIELLKKQLKKLGKPTV